MNAKSVLKYASEQGAKFVSTRFTDLPGSWQHLTFPISQLDEGSFEDGFGFDASSIRGWAAIHESDMLLIPDPYKVWMDPFAKEPTLCLVCNAVDPISRQGYAYDPRNVAVRAESYLKSTGIADVANFGPEAEFFIFDSVQFENEPQRAGYAINSDEGHWNSGRDANDNGPNLGHRIRPKEGYVPCAPIDTLIDLRSEISLILADCGINVECLHHEVATAG
ncbi:MAG TPA: glutamine synthetase beta-grasp domain-containing protein, partial [Pyrinomonadaceae bacterium]|nr:glutamine synthetase beta-grasp domain-containing protein [Pyrinomonadaceae bacterium]